ncbi:MAG: hypothetical protein IJZ56_03240 [Oscillospiraceae bacterium]|nr:hypothetical protein [Oscillospiraceae bacterium]
MDRRQLKVLVEIRDTEKYEYTTDPDWKVNIIHYLARQGYIYYHSDDLLSQNKYCFIKEEGRAAIYELHKERRRWFIPMAVSIFAAIGGYREELRLLLQAASSIWRSITGG